MKKTKIIATLGPASQTKEVIAKMVEYGMDVARLNFSHGSYEDHLTKIKIVREVAKEKKSYVGILADTKGPEMRVGMFRENQAFLKKDSIIQLYKNKVVGDENGFYINQEALFQDIKIKDLVLLDDGKIHLEVIEKNDLGFMAKVLNDGMISNRKGVNVPDVKLSMPFISEEDYQDILFAIENEFDLLALSFVRRVDDVLEVKKIIDSKNSKLKIVAKIENQESYDSIDEILNVVDGIMVARGDLGVEIDLGLVPIYQKKLIKKANDKGVAVITATHMMESMMSTPQPTRAEASDVANAILDGTDAIMLSGETAAGKYPLESIKMMTKIALATEKIIDHKKILSNAVDSSLETVSDVIGISVSQAAISLKKLKAIIAFTETGGTARRLSKFRPSVPIIAICHKPTVGNQLAYFWGIYSAYEPMVGIEYYDDVAREVALNFGFKKGDMIAITSGWLQQHGSTNTLRIIEI